MAERSSALLFAVICLYFAVSFPIFNKVFQTSKTVIDELYHLRQGFEYCSLNFTYWNPKITTLPGLYIISAIFLSPFAKCSTYFLRLTNIVASCVNLFLFAKLFNANQTNSKKNSEMTFKSIVQALNLSILPPLFFFSHVYYTDTLAITFLLGYFYFAHIKQYVISALFGLVSIIVRQTNVIWVGLRLGKLLIDIFYWSYVRNYKSKRNKHLKGIQNYTFKELLSASFFHLKHKLVYVCESMTLTDTYNILSMLIIVKAFIIFVYINGSIVVGDKSAHMAAFHFPQMFYFTIFYGIFSLPFVLNKSLAVVRVLLDNKIATFAAILLYIFLVHVNTIIHPYLLADNRHYTFYVWNKFYGKYFLARYLIVPVYIFLTVGIFKNVNHNESAGFWVTFCFCATLSIALQRMIEVRYFLIPYIILRLKSEIPSWTLIISETFLYVVINALTFNIFFTKEIFWTDFEDIQRLIW